MTEFTLNEQQLCAIVMAAIPVSEDITLKMIRERFMKRDRQWTEAEAKAEYRYQQARAIIDRSKRSEP